MVTFAYTLADIGTMLLMLAGAVAIFVAVVLAISTIGGAVIAHTVTKGRSKLGSCAAGCLFGVLFTLFYVGYQFQPADRGRLLRLEVTPQDYVLPLNTTRVYKVKGFYQRQREYDVTSEVEWEAGPAVRVAPGGRVTGKKVGPFGLSVSLQGQSASATGRVTSAKLTSLELSPKRHTIDALTYFRFTGTAHWSDGTSDDVSDEVQFYSSNPSVGQIHLGKSVRGYGSGSTVITGSYRDTKGEAVLQVK